MSYFFSFLYHTSLIAWMIQVLLYYTVQDIFKDYSTNHANRDAAQHSTPFSKAGLRKFVIAKELFVPRPCFLRHLTTKSRVMFSWLPLQVIFSIWYFKPQLKTKIWNYIVLLSTLVKEPVCRQFFIVSELEICKKLSIKVNSFLARVLKHNSSRWTDFSASDLK